MQLRKSYLLSEDIYLLNIHHSLDFWKMYNREYNLGFGASHFSSFGSCGVGVLLETDVLCARFNGSGLRQLSKCSQDGILSLSVGSQ